MKIDKLIVSVDNSHYKDYWPLIAKMAKKVLKVTPILIKVFFRTNQRYPR